MTSWLETHAPRRFDQLAIPLIIREMIERAAIQANPPHLLIAGPSGVGKTACWRLVARQILGPGWQSTTHVLQARDLSGTSGAMSKFENFLRPGGKLSSDTLAGRSSLDAFDSNIISTNLADPPPSGSERTKLPEDPNLPISRIIVIEDADYLGPKRQPYLRRMMETSSHTSRFIFTARSPSRIIDALRSRMQQIRLPATSNELVINRLKQISRAESIEVSESLYGDFAHVVNGNLRRAIHLFEMLSRKNRLNERRHLQELVNTTTYFEIQRVLEEALRGRIHLWRWEKKGSKNQRVLKGAMGALDDVMKEHAMHPDDIVYHLHKLIVTGRLLLDEKLLSKLLESLSKCDVRLQRSMQGRIQLERFFHEVAKFATSQ